LQHWLRCHHSECFDLTVEWALFFGQLRPWQLAVTTTFRDRDTSTFEAIGAWHRTVANIGKLTGKGFDYVCVVELGADDVPHIHGMVVVDNTLVNAEIQILRSQFRIYGLETLRKLDGPLDRCRYAAYLFKNHAHAPPESLVVSRGLRHARRLLPSSTRSQRELDMPGGY
jgi:hypothetical protein